MNSKPTYTEIPPTSDLNYWQVKVVDAKSKVFIPQDKKLHRSLKLAAWKKIQAQLPNNLRTRISTADED